MNNKLSFKELYRNLNKVSDFAALIAGVLIMIAGFIVVYGIIIRYLGYSAIWQIELASYLLIFAVFIASASALHHNVHIKVDLLITNIKEKSRDILYIITGIIGLLFSIAIFERGLTMWYDAYMLGWRSNSVWGLTLAYPYAIIPIGMMWFALQYILEISMRFHRLFKKNSLE